jgi:hypothetical protein
VIGKFFDLKKKKKKKFFFFFLYRFSRNNVLHLWPYTIYDLRAIGVKYFFGQFCAGQIDHISNFFFVWLYNIDV